MGAEIECATLAQVRRLIGLAAEVQASVRFSVVETEVRISKADARRLLDGVPDDETPSGAEMPCGYFATYDPETCVLRLG